MSDFALEFYAYNLSTSDILRKLYVKSPYVEKTPKDSSFILDENKAMLLNMALNNDYLVAYTPKRYCLYDISFRESDYSESIGLCFNDVQDSIFLEPEQVYIPFMDFGLSKFCKTIKKVENSIFGGQPQYNPLFMIGLLFEANSLTRVKAYIRYNEDEAPSIRDRVALIEQVVRIFNDDAIAVAFFSDLSKRLENRGFTFAFVGIDCYKDGSERYKLYFRNYEESNAIRNDTLKFLCELGLSNELKDIVQSHKNGMWGIAISTKDFISVNGVQLYLYP